MKASELLALALLGTLAFGQSSDAQIVKRETGAKSSRSPGARQIQIPSRPAASLFQGEQGKQRSEIHHDETVDADDVGVIQRRGRLGLLDESPFPLGIGDFLRRQHLDGDESIEMRVTGLVDDTHAAFAELLEDAVVRDLLADHNITLPRWGCSGPV